MTIELKKAAAGLLKATFHKAKEGFLNQYTDKYTERLVCDMPADNGSKLVVEGSFYGKGNWRFYIETPVPGGGRIFRDEKENIPNSQIVHVVDDWVTRHQSDSLDTDVIRLIHEPLREAIAAQAPKALGHSLRL